MRLEWDGEAVIGDKEEVVNVQPNKYCMGRITITGAQMQAAATQHGAFVRAVEAEVEALQRFRLRALQGDYAQGADWAQRRTQDMQNQANYGNYANLLGGTVTFTGGLIAADGFDHYPTRDLPTAWERLGRAVRRLPLPGRLRRLMGLPSGRESA